jgi:hypothetical protein
LGGGSYPVLFDVYYTFCSCYSWTIADYTELAAVLLYCLFSLQLHLVMSSTPRVQHAMWRDSCHARARARHFRVTASSPQSSICESA